MEFFNFSSLPKNNNEAKSLIKGNSNGIGQQSLKENSLAAGSGKSENFSSLLEKTKESTAPKAATTPLKASSSTTATKTTKTDADTSEMRRSQSPEQKSLVTTSSANTKKVTPVQTKTNSSSQPSKESAKTYDANEETSIVNSNGNDGDDGQINDRQNEPISEKKPDKISKKIDRETLIILLGGAANIAHNFPIIDMIASPEAVATPQAFSAIDKSLGLVNNLKSQSVSDLLQVPLPLETQLKNLGVPTDDLDKIKASGLDIKTPISFGELLSTLGLSPKLAAAELSKFKQYLNQELGEGPKISNPLNADNLGLGNPSDFKIADPNQNFSPSYNSGVELKSKEFSPTKGSLVGTSQHDNLKSNPTQTSNLNLSNLANGAGLASISGSYSTAPKTVGPTDPQALQDLAQPSDTHYAKVNKAFTPALNLDSQLTSLENPTNYPSGSLSRSLPLPEGVQISALSYSAAEKNSTLDLDKAPETKTSPLISASNNETNLPSEIPIEKLYTQVSEQLKEGTPLQKENTWEYIKFQGFTPPKALENTKSSELTGLNINLGKSDGVFPATDLTLKLESSVQPFASTSSYSDISSSMPIPNNLLGQNMAANNLIGLKNPVPNWQNQLLAESLLAQSIRNEAKPLTTESFDNGRPGSEEKSATDHDSTKINTHFAHDSQGNISVDQSQAVAATTETKTDTQKMREELIDKAQAQTLRGGSKLDVTLNNNLENPIHMSINAKGNDIDLTIGVKDGTLSDQLKSDLGQLRTSLQSHNLNLNNFNLNQQNFADQGRQFNAFNEQRQNQAPLSNNITAKENNAIASPVRRYGSALFKAIKLDAAPGRVAVLA